MSDSATPWAAAPCQASLSITNSQSLLKLMCIELSLILDEIIIQKQEQYIPTVEIRNASEVLYLTEKEILYCENKHNSRKITIHLADGSTAETENFLTNFYTELIPFGTFFIANKNVIINARYVEKAGIFKVTLQDGTCFRLTATSASDVMKLKGCMK